MNIETNSTTGQGAASDDGPVPQEASSALSQPERGEVRDELRSEVREDKESGCPPPDDPIMVYCLHCGREYMSSEMVPPDGVRTPIMMAGLWWCGTPGCNAGGFGLDIFPTDSEWKDPKGLLHLISDSEDEEEFEWDEDDEE